MRSATSLGSSAVLFPLWFPARWRHSVVGERRHDAGLPHVGRAYADLAEAQGRETGSGIVALGRSDRSDPGHHCEFLAFLFSAVAGGSGGDHLFRWRSIQNALRGVIRRGRAEAPADVWTTADGSATVCAAAAKHGIAAAPGPYTFLMARQAHDGGTGRSAERHREHHPLARQRRSYKPVVASRNV